MKLQAIVSSTRRYELDWLRVVAIFAVFIFHTARFFDTYDWSVKNTTMYPALDMVSAFVTIWGMPLIFVISGASTFYALGKRRGDEFVRGRALRLLVPLVVGMFSHLAWQMYLDRLTHGRFSGSFLEFIPHYFQGLDAFGGNFPWYGIHLWYLELLFVYSLVCLPLFLWLRRGSGQRVLAWLGDRLAFPGGVYLLAAPLVVVEAGLSPDSVPGARAFAAWSMVSYLVIFVMGFALVAHERLYDGARRMRGLSLVVALALTIGLAVQIIRWGDPAYGTALYLEVHAARAVMCWCWILTIVGFSAQYLRFPTRLLGYANEAVLPFYILSQSVLLTVGYHIMPLPVPDGVKWLATGLLSFVLCLVLYEFLVRRINLLRVLFGMAPVDRAPEVVPVPGQ